MVGASIQGYKKEDLIQVTCVLIDKKAATKAQNSEWTHEMLSETFF